MTKLFFNRCLCLVSKLNRKTKDCQDTSLKNSFLEYEKMRPPHFQVQLRANITHILNEIAKDMVTNLNTYYDYNFYDRVTKYLKIRFNYNRKESYD